MAKLINIDNLSENELRDLNSRVVDRLRAIQQERKQQFAKGDLVLFESPNNPKPQKALVKKINKKSIDIIRYDGVVYRVSPNFLTLVTKSKSVPVKEKSRIISAHVTLEEKARAEKDAFSQMIRDGMDEDGTVTIDPSNMGAFLKGKGL